MDVEEESCNTELGLGLSIIHQSVPKRKQQSDSENNDNKNERYSTRKKLRLTKEQINLLEDNFRLHSTLINSDKKHALAQQLNLQPRQVEVWFQNKRARTKLKKTEVDCEFLEKCCKSLSEENQILKNEVQRLRELKQLAISSAPLYIQFLPKAATTLKMCAGCEKNVLKAGEGKAAAVLGVIRQANKLESGSKGINLIVSDRSS